MKKVFVTTNCQTYGLINSMSVLAKNATVTGKPYGQINRMEDLGEYDFVFTAPTFRDQICKVISAEKIATIPFIFFDRFHPDLTYVKSDSETVLGPLDAYHSLIVLGGYLHNLDEKDCLKYFTDSVFASLGYYSGWSEAQETFESEFAVQGINVKPAFQRWLSSGSFMHSINHPNIQCIFDVARLALEKIDIATYDYPNCPVHDNLLQASNFPIYPEIAAQLSLAGSYTFKRHGTYASLNLSEFVHASYATYANYDKKTLRVGDSMQRVYQAFEELLK